MQYIAIFLAFNIVYAILLALLSDKRLRRYIKASKLPDPYVLSDAEKEYFIDYMTNFNDKDLQPSNTYGIKKITLLCLALLMYTASLYDFMTIHNSLGAGTTAMVYITKYAFPTLYFVGSLAFYIRYEHTKTAYLRALYKEEREQYSLKG